MRNELFRNTNHHPRIIYRGEKPSRLDNLTDTVFGIAITLLIFNIANPNSFTDLLTFTKTLPAFIISITFIILIWYEHLRFSEIYTINDFFLSLLNILFISLIIFYVYPLRFLTLFLTNFFFHTNINVNIQGSQVPHLMIYYGFAAFSLYFIIYLLYLRAHKMKDKLSLNEYEIIYTKLQMSRLFIMFSVPLLSIALTVIINPLSFILASIIGGAAYLLYTPLILWWHHKYEKEQNFEKEIHQ